MERFSEEEKKFICLLFFFSQLEIVTDIPICYQQKRNRERKRVREGKSLSPTPKLRVVEFKCLLSTRSHFEREAMMTTGWMIAQTD